MAHRKTSKRSKARSMLRLADLEQSKNAVLHSLGAASSQESYGHAIDGFIEWYCSEPLLSRRNRVVLRAFRLRCDQPSTSRLAQFVLDEPHERRLPTRSHSPVLGYAISQVENLSKFSFYLDTHRFRQPSGLGCKQKRGQSVNDNLGLEDT